MSTKNQRCQMSFVAKSRNNPSLKFIRTLAPAKRRCRLIFYYCKCDEVAARRECCGVAGVTSTRRRSNDVVVVVRRSTLILGRMPQTPNLFFFFFSFYCASSSSSAVASFYAFGKLEDFSIIGGSWARAVAVAAEVYAPMFYAQVNKNSNHIF